VAERYAYDVDGYRVVRYPEGGKGWPVISLRDGSGEAMSEFMEAPTDVHPTLDRDFVQGLGMLLVERRRSLTRPAIAGSAPVSTTSGYGFTLTEGVGATSYGADIRTESGAVTSRTGITPDAQDQFWIPESGLLPIETNLVSVRKDDGDIEPYSEEVRVAFDPNVTTQSANQIRAISLSRVGNDLTLRWALLQNNGKKTKIYFTRAVGNSTIALTPTGLAAGVTSYTLSDQALASPHGTIWMTQTLTNGTGETPPSVAVQFRANIFQVIDDPLDENPGCGGSCTPPPPGYIFANGFHHRDHLGNLRIVTDDSGTPMTREDYYAFGTEMTPPATPSSTRKFTGHERDEATGMDYMKARYQSASMGRFLAVDPSSDSAQAASPQSWNRFAYVSNSPLNLIDPTGEVPVWGPSFIQRVQNDPDFREAVRDFRRTEIGQALTKSLNDEQNKTSTFTVERADHWSFVLGENIEDAGVTTPETSAPGIKNWSGKLDSPDSLSKINADYWKKNEGLQGAELQRQIATTLFVETTNALNLTSGTKTPNQANLADNNPVAVSKFQAQYDAIQTRKRAVFPTIRHGRSNFMAYPDTRETGAK
jgi:RHS repeat-associated protein